jgi:hypothetical protein
VTETGFATAGVMITAGGVVVINQRGAGHPLLRAGSPAVAPPRPNAAPCADGLLSCRADAWCSCLDGPPFPRPPQASSRQDRRALPERKMEPQPKLRQDTFDE